jgi:hypothetical protein
MEERGRLVRVGTVFPVGELTGSIVLGADHVTVRGEDDVVVPRTWVAYVAELPGGAA